MKKPVLYIIHGWTYTVAPWSRTIALLEKRGLKVEMLHVPGLTTGSRKVWTIEDYVRWADRNIPTGSIALGHSNGGRILLNLCREKPDKLKQLILLDAAGVYEASTKRDLARGVSKKLGFLKKIPGFTKVWHKLTGATDYARAPENMKQTLANMLDSDTKLDLSKVATPTTILWGASDTVTPPRQAEAMHAQIPNNTLEIFPDWTHAPYLSHPDELAKAIYRVYDKPPVIKPAKTSATDAPAADAAAISAAFALKRAPEPMLESKDSNPVAPDVPTKLVLRKDDQHLTKGLRISDEEGAAVKYEPKTPEVARKSTDAAEISASANMRRAKTSIKPDTDAASASASATIKKSSRKTVEQDPSDSSASLALKKAFKAEKSSQSKSLDDNTTSILAELAEKTDREVGFEPLDACDRAQLPIAASHLDGAITSASVPKVSRFERAKRKVTKSKSAKLKTAKVKTAQDSSDSKNIKANSSSKAKTASETTSKTNRAGNKS